MGIFNMLILKYYTARINETDNLTADFDIKPKLMHALHESQTKFVTLEVFQILFLYCIRSLIAQKKISPDDVVIYVDDVKHDVNEHGRFIKYPPDDLFDQYIDDILRAK